MGGSFTFGGVIVSSGSAVDLWSTNSFIFGSWELCSDGILLHKGNSLHLPPKELHVLRLLLSSAGALVSKELLLSRVWPNCDIAEESLTRCIYTLRKVLGRDNVYIKTLYGKGYRFVGEVTERRVASAGAPSVAPSLLVLPLAGRGNGCMADVQREVVRQLAAAFGEGLCVFSAGVTVGIGDEGYLALVERLQADYYLAFRRVEHVKAWTGSVELVRGRDHALLHSEVLDEVSCFDQVMQQVLLLIADRLPGLRPQISPCSSYPLAQAYVNGLLGLRIYTPEGLGEALQEFLRCLQLDPGYAPLWCGLADTYLAMANLGLKDHHWALTQAYRALTQALTLEPENAQASVRLALLTSLQGVPHAAEALFRRALLGPDRAGAHYHYAWHLWCCGRFGQALHAVEQSLEQDCSSVAAWLLRARIELEVDALQALDVIEQAMAVLGDRHPVINAMHALTLDVSGEPLAAQAVLERGGLLEGQSGEVELVVCYVQAAFDKLAARERYRRWCVASEHPPLCPAQLPVLRRLDGDRAAAGLWRELEGRSCPWWRARLGDPRLQGLAKLIDERLLA